MREYFAVVVGALAVWSSCARAQNVALGKPVSIVAGSAEGESPATIVDGLFVERGTLWQEGTVWWQGLDTTIQIDLGATYLIGSLVAQVDDNDAYDVLYRVPGTSTWELLWAVPNYNEFGSGMQTRPNPDNLSDRYFLPAAVETDALRLVANSGDDFYAASELQAWIVPGPGSAALMILAGISALRRNSRENTRV